MAFSSFTEYLDKHHTRYIDISHLTGPYGLRNCRTGAYSRKELAKTVMVGNLYGIELAEESLGGQQEITFDACTTEN